jgi:hypothetical protein
MRALRSGLCVACFRPALVFDPRRGARYWVSVAAATDVVEVEGG